MDERAFVAMAEKAPATLARSGNQLNAVKPTKYTPAGYQKILGGKVHDILVA
jgi:hypothetical protein